ncbi:MAG: hypothetical protein ACEPOV_06155 [Hyphomicrobiales bacterium]
MDSLLKEICEALEDLSANIEKEYHYGLNLSDHSSNDIYPKINELDLSKIPLQISKKLRSHNIKNIDANLRKSISSLPLKIIETKRITIPNFYTENGSLAIPAFITIMEWVKTMLDPLFSFERLENEELLPKKLKNKLDSINVRIKEIEPETEQLENKIKLIKEAHDTANNLPIELKYLKDTRHKVKQTSNEISLLFSKVKELEKEASKKLKLIEEKEKATCNLVEKCDEAYRITTTQGLAASFDQRAKRNTRSMWVWIVILIASLSIIGYIGHNRYEHFTNTFDSTNINWGFIWMKMAISFITMAAPVWLAWMSTKQITQRFKLAEDYHYKATVAKSYEGYRKEAVSLDKKFQDRLFDTALTRFEEAPLRLMDKENHGSPFHEFFNSSLFDKMLSLFPEVRDRLQEKLDSFNKKEQNGSGKQEIEKETASTKN